MRALTMTLAGAALLLGACATDPNRTGYTGNNREPASNCRVEKRTGSNIKKARCGPARDDSDRLRTIGTIDSVAGHARTAGDGGI